MEDTKEWALEKQMVDGKLQVKLKVPSWAGLLLISAYGVLCFMLGRYLRGE